MSNRQLTFNEFIDKEFDDVDVYCGINKLSHYAISKISWNFCQAQEQKEIEFLKAENSIILAQFSKVDMERLRLEKENESLKKKLEKANGLMRYISSKNCPSDINDRVDAYLKENEG